MALGGWQKYRNKIGKGDDRTTARAKDSLRRANSAEDFWLQRTITTVGVANGASAAAIAAAIANDLVCTQPAFFLFRTFVLGALLAGAVPALLLWRNFFPDQEDDEPANVLYGSKATAVKRKARWVWWQVRHFLPWIALCAASALLVIGIVKLNPSLLT